MYPALRDGATVWASPHARVRLGFCAVVPAPTPSGWVEPDDGRVKPSGRGFYIKRILAIGPTTLPDTEVEEMTMVPEGTLFLRGDNPNSLDSRQLGPCPLRCVVAVTVRRYGDVPAERA
jgi:hypothetical protein